MTTCTSLGRATIAIGSFLLVLASSALSAETASTSSPESRTKYRQWIVEMKEAPRGPFSNVKWYCKDGTVFPPTEYACAKGGGGVQHDPGVRMLL